MARILVADDNADARELLRIMLREAGHDVFLAVDGDEAVAVFKSERPDLSIVDVFMPAKDGIDTIREIRRDFPQARIVAISAGWRLPHLEVRSPFWDFDVLADARAVGADAALPKPIVAEALLAVVNGLTAQSPPIRRTPRARL